jgi:hypothetical protein
MSLEALHQLIIKDTGGELTITILITPATIMFRFSVHTRLDGWQSPAASAATNDSSTNKARDHAYSNEEIMADLTALMETHVIPTFRRQGWDIRTPAMLYYPCCWRRNISFQISRLRIFIVGSALS